MKLLALTEINNPASLVTIHMVLEWRRQEPAKWARRVVFDIIRARPMVAVDRGGKGHSSFRFMKGISDGHGEGSKGIAHELFQEALCEQKQINFVDQEGKTYEISVDRAEDEVGIKRSKDPRSLACVDVMLYPSKDCSIRGLGSRIAVEITDTHGTSSVKRELFKELGIVAIEIDISMFHIPNNESIDLVDIDLLRQRIFCFLQWPIAMSWINEPRSTEEPFFETENEGPGASLGTPYYDFLSSCSVVSTVQVPNEIGRVNIQENCIAINELKYLDIPVKSHVEPFSEMFSLKSIFCRVRDFLFQPV